MFEFCTMYWLNQQYMYLILRKKTFTINNRYLDQTTIQQQYKAMLFMSYDNGFLITWILQQISI